MSQRPSRRGFLAGLAGFGLGFGIAPMVFSAPKTNRNAKNPKPRPVLPETGPSPYSDLRVGFVGVGGRGRGDFEEIAKLGVTVAAICDVDVSRMVDLALKYP